MLNVCARACARMGVGCGGGLGRLHTCQFNPLVEIRIIHSEGMFSVCINQTSGVKRLFDPTCVFSTFTNNIEVGTGDNND